MPAGDEVQTPLNTLAPPSHIVSNAESAKPVRVWESSRPQSLAKITPAECLRFFSVLFAC